jgi:lysophospholipase L1-like esterase
MSAVERELIPADVSTVLPCGTFDLERNDGFAMVVRMKDEAGCRARTLPNDALIRFAALLSCLLPLHLHAVEPTNAWARLGDVHHIVFLGDSITYSGQYVEFIETYFVTRFTERRIEILNLGLPSETVSGLSEDGHAGGKFPRPELRERLARVLEKAKPDLVIACYGMNDGIYLPFSEERFQKFKDGIAWLRESVAASGAKSLHVTPPTFDEMKGGHPGYANTLDRYSDWLLAQRLAGWDVVDLHGPMNRYLTERRQKEPDFFLAIDGVHCGETGHWIIAKQILLHLGAKDVAKADDPQAMLVVHPRGGQILKLVQEKQRLMKDAWLTETGHKRPGMNKGLPLAEAQAKAAELEEQIRQLATTAQSPWTGTGSAGIVSASLDGWSGIRQQGCRRSACGLPVLLHPAEH